MVKVVFLHPDLGIGGAEKAMIDAAVALKSNGHDVSFVTAHHDRNHCFQETRDGTVQVTAVGDWLPRQFLGRFYAFFAYLRMVYAALYLVVFSSIQYDLIICDQISACVPVLKLSRKRIIFYCHFPDLLLTQRDSFLKRVYRYPIDWLEEWTTGMADCVLVNSKFTAGIFHDTFKSLQHIEPRVVYPVPNFASMAVEPEKVEELWADSGCKDTVFLSINRYERKKNINLAIEAFASLVEKRESADGLRLVVAGGYDERVTENREHYEELYELAQQLDVGERVTFLCSISGGQKAWLLGRAACLIYTPDREHFGIVPVEAMYARCPVVAVASGGPLETVVDGETGFLREADCDEFADAMTTFIPVDCSKCDGRIQSSRGLLMGEEGRKRVIKHFSSQAYARELNAVVYTAVLSQSS